MIYPLLRVEKAAVDILTVVDEEQGEATKGAYKTLSV